MPGTFDGTDQNLFVRDLTLGTTTLATASNAGQGGIHTISRGVDTVNLSNDGSAVVFASRIADLVPADANASDDVFLFQAIALSGTGTISGTVFDDPNGNGEHDQGEAPLEGWTVFLDLLGDGTLDSGDPSVVTGPDGTYAFTSLPAGTYTVAEVVRPGYQQTSPAAPGTFSVSLAAGQTVGNENFEDQFLSPDLAVEPFDVPVSGRWASRPISRSR